MSVLRAAFLLGAAAVFAFAICCPAQESIHFASVAGNVTDSSGAVIPGAEITARQSATNLPRVVTTDSAGRFRFPYLPVGRYEICVHASGFSELRRVLDLSVGAAFDLSLRVSVASSSATVQVEDRAPVLETARSQIANTISQHEVATLPLNGRNFLDLALLVPGVSPTNTTSTQLFAETSAVPGQGLSINGQRNLSNSFVVDGLSANDDAAGVAGTMYSVGSIQELQVVTSGGQAEFGRSMGGYVSVVTKSGTNALHGDVYGFLKNRSLNAANALAATRVPTTQAQYGASIGGPIVRNRTFYFANFEQRRLNQSGVMTIQRENAEAINQHLQASGYEGEAVFTGLYSNPVRTTNFLAKVDHALRQKDSLNVRYSLYGIESDNSRNVGGLNAVSAGSGLSNRDHSIAFSNVYTFSSRTVNETRGQFTSSDLRSPVNDPFGPAVSIAGVASFGTAPGSPTARLNRYLELVNNISHLAGNRSFRVGGDLLYNNLKITYPRALRGSYTFSSLAKFQQGIYSSFTQTFGDPVVRQSNPNIGFFVQDEWRLRPDLTVNAGIRYDLQFLDTIAIDTNNVSPRLGLAWAVTPRTVVRASAGLFYDRVPLRPLANAVLSADNSTDLGRIQQQTAVLAFGQSGAPSFPAVLDTIPADSRISITTMDPHLQNAYSEQAGVEVERQLSDSATISLNYQQVRGAHLILSINQNVPACSAALDPVNLCRPNSLFQNNSQYSGAADSHYNALGVSYLQRPSRFGGFRVSYTYSKAFDDVGQFFFSSPIDPFNVQKDWGRSDNDQRHRVVLDGYVRTSNAAAHSKWQHLMHGFQLGAVLQYYSALPFNILSGVNTVQQTPGRPCYGLAATDSACTIESMIGRNAGRGFDYFNLSTRLTRTFPLSEQVRLQAIAEAFNALNHRNDMIPNSTFGAGEFPDSPISAFQQATAVAESRSFQLALRLSF